VAEHQRALGTSLTFSFEHRVCEALLNMASKQIQQELKKANLRRPANEDPMAVAKFEDDLATIYLEALAKCGRAKRQEDRD